jgi:ABC-type Fe3+-hydroxamate transport system substrate-binding protein
MGRSIELEDSPSKIISLVPSITELLYYFGLKNQICGVTKFCIYPAEKSENVQQIGGTKNFREDLIREICPDLILANKEENHKEGIEALEKTFPVWISDVNNVIQAIDMIRSIGYLVQKEIKALKLIEQIEQNWSAVHKLYSGSVLYLIWNDPIMAVGNNTYVDHVLSHLGFRNTMSSYERYPEVTADLLSSLNPDYVFLSSEPFPFKERHIKVYQKLFPHSKFLLVDGEMFSWYGSRMLYAPEYFKTIKV